MSDQVFEIDARVEKVLESIKTRVSEFNYNNWFKSSVWLVSEDAVIIEVPSKFVRDWMQENYLSVIRFEFFKLTNREHEVTFKVNPSLSAKMKQSGLGLPPTLPISKPITASGLSTQKPAETRPLAGYPNLNPRYSFDNFVVGNHNQLVYAAARAVSQKPGKSYNPLFIYGGVGLGKTHIINAISLEILKHHPHWKVRMVTGEQFTNEVINSIRYQKTDDFRQRYRSQCDVLLIDDIQFLAGKERTMEEFFHTFNALFEARKQIILTSDILPKDMPQLEDRLRSRFSWGLMADIQPPDFETRVAILKKKAEEDNITVGDDVCHFLASQILSNVRDLEGCLIRVAAFASLSGTSITLNLAREVFEKTRPSHSISSRVSIESIQELVAGHYRLRVIDLKSPRRHKNLALPRQIAMYLCKKHVKASYPEIGNKFGGKDHTTVMHAFQKISGVADRDELLKVDLEELEKKIYG